MKSGKTIDEIILQHSTRGMDILQNIHPIEHCKIATENFLKLEKGTVFLYTGFYVGGHAETDGPIGTYFLARALNILGYKSIIITDEFCTNFFKEIDTILIPLSGYSEEKYLEILDTYNPICHISIERCGKNTHGKYANMRGKDIGENTAPVDDLFSLGGKTKPTFAVGDGGNEIGMGNFKESIENDLSLVPCVVRCDYPIIASVSNWGAYGFIAYLESFYANNVFPTFNDVDIYLDYIVSLGSVDGVKSENVKSVDGKEWHIEKEILADLKTSIIDHHNTFTMAETYDENSKSQMNIGLQLIEKLLPSLKDNTTLLDIGCGPGNLTNAIYEACLGKNISISGMDIDSAVIKKAQSNYPNINFFVGSFFINQLPSKYDYIFSNEAIHWTPLIPKDFFNENGIIYYFFNEDQKRKYRDWGLENLKNTFQFINNNLSLKAIIQFGLDGQLYNIYKVINETLLELFPNNIKDIKFPLFYPTFDELKSIIDNHTNLEIEEYKIETVALTEKNTHEILGFIKGFIHNSLLSVLGLEKLNQFYISLEKKIKNDIDNIRENQWNHCVLVIKQHVN